MKRHGLTLLELMVAMILTGILAWIALGMFSGESANFQRTREKIKLQSDSREGIRILEEELRNAGYANVLTGSSRIAQTVSTCSQVRYSTEGEAISETNSGSLSTGDAVSVRFYEIPSSGVLSTCATGSSSQFREISYRLNSGKLERRYRRDTADATASWIPILENVVSFQIQYGMVTAVDDYPASLTPAQTSNSANWSGQGTSFTIGGTSSQVELTGWTTLTSTARLTTPIDTMRQGEAYRVTFTATANAALLDATNGYDSSLATASPYMGSRLSFLREDGTESNRVGFRLPTIANVPQDYEIFLVAQGNTNTGSNPTRICYRGRLRAGASSAAGQKLTLTNVVVRRANRTNYYRWLDAPTSAEMAQVGAMRVTLLVKSAQSDLQGSAPTFTKYQLGDTAVGNYTASGTDAKRSHILYQRIIPVVNNVL